MLMHVALQPTQRVEHRAKSVAGPLRRRVTVGEFGQLLQVRPNLRVFGFELGKRAPQRGNRRSPGCRCRTPVTGWPETPDAPPFRCARQFRTETLEPMADFAQSRLVVAVDRRDFARHEVQSQEFLPKPVVMRAFDVVAKLAQAHGVGIGRWAFRRAIQHGQHGNDGGRIEVLGAADLFQRLLATAAIINTQDSQTLAPGSAQREPVHRWSFQH